MQRGAAEICPQGPHGSSRGLRSAAGERGFISQKGLLTWEDVYADAVEGIDDYHQLATLLQDTSKSDLKRMRTLHYHIPPQYMGFILHSTYNFLAPHSCHMVTDS